MLECIQMQQIDEEKTMPHHTEKTNDNLTETAMI